MNRPRMGRMTQTRHDRRTTFYVNAVTSDRVPPATGLFLSPHKRANPATVTPTPMPTRPRRRIPRRVRRWAGRVNLWPKLEIGSALLAIVFGAASYAVLAGYGVALGFTPPAISLLIVMTLLPIMALIVLIARRIVILVGNKREGRVGARLHLRLVALFAGVAALPTLLVVAFAVVLFQYGVQFWFSGRVQDVLVNADRVSQAYVVENQARLKSDLPKMVGDLRDFSTTYRIEGPEFQNYLVFQAQGRNLTSAGVFLAMPHGPRWLATTTPESRPPTMLLTRADIDQADHLPVLLLPTGSGHVAAIARLNARIPLYLYASRGDPKVIAQATLSRSALNDYKRLIAKSRQLQFRFNLLLGVVSLLLLAGAIWAALRLATQLVTPIGRLALAAERVGEGDLTARVPVAGAPDEIASLARAFNRMTAQLGVQQRALLQAGEQIDRRRQLTEAVLAGVSAGVLSVDGAGVVRMLNGSAATLLQLSPEEAVGTPLETLVPELAAVLDGGIAPGARGEVTIVRNGETQTLAVQVVRPGGAPGGERTGAVVTFDDISAQLADQRRAAWADVARRIAHEIKNPLTPIQLSAERLQRKYGAEIASDPETFAQLTGTIVRQVGDLRRMVDEFSAFARMPAPLFAPAAPIELAQQALLLQEVAHPRIAFALDAPPAISPLVCDRGQIARALTNLLQNAAEAVAARMERDGKTGEVGLALVPGPGTLAIVVTDNGVGLPAAERNRLTEPYVTTRARGTGLGLAIVKKIVEDHDGTLELADAPGTGTGTGGAIVTVRLDTAALAARLAPLAQAAE